MKLALVFFGIHFLQGYKHCQGWITNIDFEKSIENYQEYIFNYFAPNYNVDVFYSTYESLKADKLFEIYKPKKYKLNKISNTLSHIEQRNARFIESLELINEYEKSNDINYDLYLITRFDLKFILCFNNLKIINDKVNVSYKTGCGDEKNLIDDNFYIITRGNLDRFIELAKSIPNNIWFHELNRYNNKFDINFMIDGFYYSHESPLYTFER